MLLFGDVTAPSTIARASLDHSSSAGQRLLLVEDNEDNRTIYSTVLRYLGYEVIEAEDGLRAVALARSEHPDLILMDISIPGMEMSIRMRSGCSLRASATAWSPSTASITW